MHVIFIDPKGEVHRVMGELGENVMHCATYHRVQGISGECAGAMACTTCHGYVAQKWAHKLPDKSAQERETLSGCTDVRWNSRLTCQISLSEELDGLTIEVPESHI